MRSEENIDMQRAVKVLQSGGIILYPTDTVWGLGCDARNPEAVSHLFELKRRPDSKAMLLLCTDLEMTAKYVNPLPSSAIDVLKNAVRPTTIIYPGARNVAPQLVAPDGTIGIRVPDSDFCKALCRGIDGPIVSTSANFAGQPTPANFDSIQYEIKTLADYVCLSGREPIPAVPSDIIKVDAKGKLHKIRVFRK